MSIVTIFDLDEVFIPYSPRFYQANDACAEVIRTALGKRAPSIRAILRQYNAIDRAAFDGSRNPNQRYTTSWLKTYEVFTRRAGIRASLAVVEALVRITTELHEPPYTLSPWAKMVLEICSRRGYAIHLITNGAKQLQTRKIQYVGIHDFFHSKWFGEDGPKAERLAQLKARYWYCPCVFVDDGRKYVRDALRCGMHAVWVQNNDTWEAFDAKLDPATHFTVTSLRSLPAIFRSLEPPQPSRSARRS